MKSKLFLAGIIAFALIFPINMSMQTIYAINSTENDNSKFVSNWEKTERGYRYTDGYPKNTMKNIDQSWYYFDEDGKKLVSQWIGNYYVDEEGIMAFDTWIGNDHVNKNGLKDDTAGWKHDGKGWWYEDTTGWYAKNATYVIDGKMYIFDNNGYMLDKNNVHLTVEQRLLLSNVAKKTSQIIVVYHTSGTHYYSALYNKVNGLWVNSGIGSSDTRVGKKGLNSNRHSGDLTTPIGAYPLTEAFGRYNNPGTSMLYHKITNNSYWGGDTAAWGKYQNRFYEGDNPAKGGEHLNDYKQYNYALNIGFNYNPVVTGKGYAIFLHCNGKGATAGCVSVPENICKSYVKNVRTGAYIIIVPSIKDFSNY